MKKNCVFLTTDGKCRDNPFRGKLILCDYEDNEYCEDYEEKVTPKKGCE